MARMGTDVVLDCCLIRDIRVIRGSFLCLVRQRVLH